MESQTRVRGYAYLEGVLRSQQRDPFCSQCSAFANTLRQAREDLDAFDARREEGEANLPPDLTDLLAEAHRGLAVLQPPPVAAGQKKAGKCRLPEGICFVKAARALVAKI